MAEKNRAIKTLMILVNVLIWGFVLYQLWPLFFGDENPPPAVTRPALRRDGLRTDTRKTDVRQTNAGLPGRDLPDLPPARELPWLAADLIPFFESIADPFRPVLVQDRPGQGVAVARVRKVVNYQPPRGDEVRKKPVMTIYRLSSIVRIGNATLALLATGAGRGTQTVSAKAGEVLPEGSRVREINFKDKYVILVKDGHVFKLVDYAPWVMLLQRPE
jgi:hypothetical protein